MPRPCIYLVAGARPNFMKIAPIVRALRDDGRIGWKIIHTGQHYDRDMNDVFFEELGIPPPDVGLGAGGGSHASQTARIMVAFEELCQRERPNAVLVVGNVNSTLACSIVAKKLCLPVGHVEAGLRSGDMGMPEEINRLVTDAIADWFFVTEPSAIEHLRREGKDMAHVHEVGHVMVDNLLYRRQNSSRRTQAASSPRVQALASALRRRHAAPSVERRCRRAAPTDVRKRYARFQRNSRWRSRCTPAPEQTSNGSESTWRSGIELMRPQPYMSFLHLWKDAAVVLTDSGGLQEETTALGVPCVTVRENTERPITVDEGTNVLAGTNPRPRHRSGTGNRGRPQQAWPPAGSLGRACRRAHRRHPGR